LVSCFSLNKAFADDPLPFFFSFLLVCFRLSSFNPALFFGLQTDRGPFICKAVPTKTYRPGGFFCPPSFWILALKPGKTSSFSGSRLEMGHLPADKISIFPPSKKLLSQRCNSALTRHVPGPQQLPFNPVPPPFFQRLIFPSSPLLVLGLRKSCRDFRWFPGCFFIPTTPSDRGLLAPGLALSPGRCSPTAPPFRWARIFDVATACFRADGASGSWHVFPWKGFFFCFFLDRCLSPSCRGGFCQDPP